ncbi:MAG: FHA domain-containing protein [Cyanobacteria bacterium P01_F01_bin.13]
MSTWLSPQIVETYGDIQRIHDLNLLKVPIRIGRNPEILEAEGYIQIGSISTLTIQRRISRVQATIIELNGLYFLKDGNGTHSTSGVYHYGQRLDDELEIHPGIQGIDIVPAIGEYTCKFQWLKNDLLNGENQHDPMETLGARNVYLQAKVEEKESEINRIVSLQIQLQEEVEALKDQRQKDRLEEVRQDEKIARQNQKIAKISTTLRKVKRMWIVIGVTVAIVAIVILGIDPDTVIKAISGVLSLLAVFGVIKTAAVPD